MPLPYLEFVRQLSENKDNGVQKRGYKILAKLAESGKVAIDVESVLKTLEGNVDGLSSAAKKVIMHVCSTSAVMLNRCLGPFPPAQFASATDPPDASASDVVSHS